MKFAAFLLCFLVLTLSALPDDCAKVAQQKSAQTIDQKPGKDAAHQTQQDDDCCTHCSPFYTCGSCIGFIISNPLIYTATLLPEKPVQQLDTYQQPFLKEIALSIWQPPQLS